MKRDFAIAGALWLALTAIGEALVLLVEFYPAAQSPSSAGYGMTCSPRGVPPAGDSS